MSRFKTIKELMEYGQELDKMGYCLEALSCFECEDWNICEYSFDPYNTDNECLANK